MYETKCNIKTHVNGTTIHSLNMLRNSEIVLFRPFPGVTFFKFWFILTVALAWAVICRKLLPKNFCIATGVSSEVGVSNLFN